MKHSHKGFLTVSTRRRMQREPAEYRAHRQRLPILVYISWSIVTCLPTQQNILKILGTAHSVRFK